MYKIIDIKSNLNTDTALEVLKESVFNPTKEKLSKRASYYQNKESIVSYGYLSGDIILGLIVIDTANKDEITILDIAVRKDQQRNGFGRKLLNHVIVKYNPKVLIAETDDDAVEFYRKNGFEIFNLEERFSNCIRYECKYFKS